MAEPSKIYDHHKYYETFKNKHADDLKIKFKCEICNGSYSYYNKSSHKKSKKHLNAIEIIKRCTMQNNNNIQRPMSPITDELINKIEC